MLSPRRLSSVKKPSKQTCQLISQAAVSRDLCQRTLFKKLSSLKCSSNKRQGQFREGDDTG
ncbi:hypothetical protein AOLI_G00305520 [Acnodon oligacanthus]